jgi:enoyl-CoA hydratase/carnithine racemase
MTVADTAFSTIDYSLTDGVALIRLNRPSRRNAINSAMSRELPRVWQQFKNDPEAVVAIVTGAGDRAFCSGADIGDLPQLDMHSVEAARAGMAWTARQNAVWKPVICAVNGATVGGGLHFVADSDIVLAAHSASFSDSHVSVGLVSGLEPVALARRMPLEAVLRMALVGAAERMDADRALQCGLVGEVVPDVDLLDRAFDIARTMAGNSPSAMARTKQAIWAAKELSLEAALDHAWGRIIEHNRGADFAEGQRAFLERRAPQWQPYTPD